MSSVIKRSIIASTGRAGSTMLFNSMIAGFRHKYKIPNLGRVVDNLYGTFVECPKFSRKLQPIYKTHCLPNEIDLNRSRVLFVYSCPIENVKSVYLRTERDGIEWFHNHQKNLRGVGDFSDLFDKDILNYKIQIERWLEVKHENCKIIDLKDLWEKQAEISGFMQLDLELPVKRLRLANDTALDQKFSIEFYKEMKNFYASL